MIGNMSYVYQWINIICWHTTDYTDAFLQSWHEFKNSLTVEIGSWIRKLSWTVTSKFSLCLCVRVGQIPLFIWGLLQREWYHSETDQSQLTAVMSSRIYYMAKWSLLTQYLLVMLQILVVNIIVSIRRFLKSLV